MKKLFYWNSPKTLKELCDLFAQTRDYCLRAMVNGEALADGEKFIISRKKGTMKRNSSEEATINVEDAKLIEAVAIYNAVNALQKCGGFKLAALAQQAAPSPATGAGRSGKGKIVMSE